MSKVSNVFFKYNGIPNCAHPLNVRVGNRLLSLAADNNLQAIGADYTRTYLILYNNIDEPNEEIVFDTYAITPQLLADAMQWVVTGDLTFLMEYI